MEQYRHIWNNAKLFFSWLFYIAGAFEAQMINQIASGQLVHLKVLN